MIKPFRIIWELIEFGLQALFVYVLVIIIFIGVLFTIIHKEKNKDSNQMGFSFIEASLFSVIAFSVIVGILSIDQNIFRFEKKELREFQRNWNKLERSYGKN